MVQSTKKKNKDEKTLVIEIPISKKILADKEINIRELVGKMAYDAAVDAIDGLRSKKKKK